MTDKSGFPTLHRFFGFIVLLGLMAPFGASAQTALEVTGAAEVREKARSAGLVRVIARVTAPPGQPDQELTGASLEAAQEVVENFMVAEGAAYAERIEGLALVVLEVEPSQLESLLASGRVAAIEEDTIERAYLDDSTPLINAPHAWSNGARGAGHAVAILDTGVDRTHTFFGTRVVSEACYSSNSPAFGASTVCPNGMTSQLGIGAATPCAVTGCDHGTHVAGIAAGNDATFPGVAPDAPIIAIQVFSRFDDVAGGPTTCADVGTASPCILTFRSDQIRALQRVRDLTGTMSIASANMSLGGGNNPGTCDADLRKPVIDELRTLGVATAIASGNDFLSNGVGAPGCISTAVTVGSTTKTDNVSSFSNSSSVVDLLAPGSSITAAIPGGGTGGKSGTSMATPHVAGAFAVLRSAQPTASVNAIQAALESTGVPVTDPRNGLTRPRIDLGAAYDQITPPPPKIVLKLADPDKRLGRNDKMAAMATITQAGIPVAGAVVDFTSDDTKLMSVSPASATTDASGVARVEVEGESSRNDSAELTAKLASANARDSANVLVPDLSRIGLILMLAGIVGLLGLGVARRKKD